MSDRTFRDGLLDGKVAYVAGGTRGMNLAIAKRFARGFGVLCSGSWPGSVDGFREEGLPLATLKSTESLDKYFLAGFAINLGWPQEHPRS